VPALPNDLQVAACEFMGIIESNVFSNIKQNPVNKLYQYVAPEVVCRWAIGGGTLDGNDTFQEAFEFSDATDAWSIGVIAHLL
jgi:hypothetical protein